MEANSPRILELRRRVQADPASIAFAQLAEECRRAGDADEAVGICRAGLAHHPGYLSARVTLGRALMEVGRLDEAAVELTTVVQSAPTNLSAIRGLAEIHQQRGNLAWRSRIISGRCSSRSSTQTSRIPSNGCRRW